MHVYMKVTTDDLELPIAIADTAKELAEIIGVHENTVYAGVSRGRKSYVRVEVEDDDEMPGMRKRELESD